MSAGSPSAPLESGRGKRLIFHHSLKLLTRKIFSGEGCLVVEPLPFTPAFPHFARAILRQQGSPVAVFHVAAAQHRHFGAISPSSESFLIPALGLPGLVTNASSPLDCNRNYFSSGPSPVAEGWLINHQLAQQGGREVKLRKPLTWGFCRKLLEPLREEALGTHYLLPMLQGVNWLWICL